MWRVGGSKLCLACAGCFLLGSIWGSAELKGLMARQAPASAAELPFPLQARTGANIYLQTSGEYRACCLQVYRMAERRLASILASTCPRPARPAVVMDLDETVLDNSAFETFLYRNHLEYADPLWAEYEEKYPQDVTLIPGAKAFIARAEAMGVTVIYISNRLETYTHSTQKALQLLGINTKNIAARLYLKPAGGKSDKTARRDAVKKLYNVLLYFGDNLRDFSESFVANVAGGANPTTEQLLDAIHAREKAVDSAAAHWGVDWFVLPNPVYGEWEKPIGPDPVAIMHPTSMRGHAPAAASARNEVRPIPDERFDPPLAAPLPRD